MDQCEGPVTAPSPCPGFILDNGFYQSNAPVITARVPARFTQSNRLPTAAEFHQLTDVPAEVE
jgi:hypothetical protein